MQIKIHIGDTVLDRELPNTPFDISLSAYCKIASIMEANEGDNKDELFNIRTCIQIVSAYYDLNEYDASMLKVRGQEGVMNIVAHIVRVIGQYRFDKDRVHIVSGVEYRLTKSFKKEEQMMASEAIEVLEINRLIKQEEKTNKIAKSDLSYTRIIKTLAVLARRNGETFPIYQPDIEQFIEERTKLFHKSNISMVAGLDAAFFLMTITSRLETLTAFTSFLTPRQGMLKLQQNVRQ